MNSKRKIDSSSTSSQPSKKPASEPVVPKPVVEKVIASAPVRYMQPPQDNASKARERDKMYQQVIANSSGYSMPNPQGIAYQDALKAVDGAKYQPQYLFPQYAPKNQNNQQSQKKMLRSAAGESWEDPSLLEWDPNDYRIFVGDMGNEVTDEVLIKAFHHYPSFQRARVIRDKRTGKSRGFGFVSFSDLNDFARAMREMNGKYVGNRPCKLKKSNWQDRNQATTK